jgi:hypothetical protein
MIWLLATILKWLGSGVLDRALAHLEKQIDSDTAREESRRKSPRSTFAPSLKIAVPPAMSSLRSRDAGGRRFRGRFLPYPSVSGGRR